MLSVVVAAWGGWLSFRRSSRATTSRPRAAVRKVLRFWACHALLLAYDSYGCLTWVPGHSLARAAAVPSCFCSLLGRSDVAFFCGLLLPPPPGRGPRCRLLSCWRSRTTSRRSARGRACSPRPAPKTPRKRRRRATRGGAIAELLRDSDDSDDEACLVRGRAGNATRPADARATRASLWTLSRRPSSPGRCCAAGRARSRQMTTFDADAGAGGEEAEGRGAARGAGSRGSGFEGPETGAVERLVGVRRRAAASGPTLSPVAFSETDEDEPPPRAPAKRRGARGTFLAAELRTRRPRGGCAAAGAVPAMSFVERAVRASRVSLASPPGEQSGN